MASPRVAVAYSRGAPVSDYLDCLHRAGLEAIDVCEAGRGMSEFTGLVITGGRDIDPALYGEPRSPYTQEPNPERDLLDFALLREALERDLPVLAICRGHQVLNVCLGGRLLQHVQAPLLHDAGGADRPSRWHAITLTKAGRLAEALGMPDADRLALAPPPFTSLEVNSRHHQAVTAEGLAPGLHAVAWSEDGLIEAVECEGRRWVVGVQWHPERPEPDHPHFQYLSQRLFAAFAASVRRA